MAAAKREKMAYSYDYIKGLIQAGTLRFSNKRSRSRVWDVFARIEDQSGAEIPNVVICRTCSSIYKYLGCTSNLVRHKCYRSKDGVNVDPLGSEDRSADAAEESNAEATDKVSQALVEWCVENCRPFNIGKDSGLRNLVSVLLEIGSEYGRNVCIEDLLPDQGVIAWNVENWYDDVLQQVRREMSAARQTGYSIAIAETRDSTGESFYLSNTVHYVRDGRKRNQLLGVTQVPRSKSSTDTYILKLLDATLKDLDCEMAEDDPIFVYDERTTIKTVFEGRRTIFCIKTLLDRVVEKTFHDVSELRQILNKAKELVILGVLPTSTAKGLVRISHIFKSLETNWSIILNEDEKLMEGCDIACLTAINNLLGQFEKCCLTLESGTEPTLHLVIPHVHRLRKFCSSDSSHEVEVELKRTLLDNIDWIVMPCITKYHMMAHFLFPPTNRLLQCSQDEREETIENCEAFMRRYSSTQHPATRKVEEVLIKGEGEVLDQRDLETDDDLFSDFVAMDSQEDRITKEMRGYRAIQMAYHDGFNVLEWWHSNREQFPLLYKTSCQILAIPASNAPSDLVLSQASNLIKDPACSIDELNRVMFLKTNLGVIAPETTN
ncbi:hypothetical protein KR054_006619 [Drosophila jambulina]|nr:hypothetical protein KR054_006619 [Drosophila jambulina]